MKFNHVISAVIFTAAFLSLGFGLPTVAAGKTGTADHTGKAMVKLRYVHAVQNNGSPAPAHDAACKKQLSAHTSRFVGMPVTTTYSINTTTLIMSAMSHFPSPIATQPLMLSAELHPLGIAGTYAFGAFRPPALKNGYVLFSVNEKFASPVSTFLIFGPKDAAYNCVISSSKKAAKLAESKKFKEQE